VTEKSPELPGLYELVIVDTTDSAKAHAERLAAEGAEEGTIVWAKHQSRAFGRQGKQWFSGKDNLHCAIILRLDEPLVTCCELSLLASICVGQAITTVGEPMEELRLGWPNDIYLNRGKVGNVQLSGAVDTDGNVSWMVVSVNVNTSEHPSSLGFNASSLKGEGFEVFERTVLMKYFAREFLAWINRWAEEGLGPVRKAWSWRGDWKDADHTVEVDGRVYNGVFHALGDNGALKLETRQGIISLDLVDFYRPAFHLCT
jgi:BirA family biotin operon repressor/biotin-[acetyl-CoA-carboxylase] ligase